MTGPAQFDRVVVVDWSASATPKRGSDSIWIATLDRRGLRLDNPPTRRSAVERVAGLLDEPSGGPTLLGVDVSLGYPAGTAAALGLAPPSWAATWRLLDELVVDDASNRNNRFEVAAILNRRLTGDDAPFWGRPATAPTAPLPATKPAPGAIAEWRTVERVLRAAGYRPSSAWQLHGAGSVGGQSLVGIPLLHRLCGRLGPRVRVWPFTTGLGLPPLDERAVVIAEVWPTLVPTELDADRVRDAVQVEATARAIAALDGAGRLGDLFAPCVDEAAVGAVLDEEGWILGAGFPDPFGGVTDRAVPAGARR